MTNAYTFVGSNTEGNAVLFVADITSETYFVADYWLPEDLNAGDNIIEFEYDQNSGELYALHWEVSTPIANVSNNLIGEFVAYPNPSTEKVYIQLGKHNGQIKIQITDMAGKWVLQKTLTTAELDISSLAPGMYNLEMFDGNEFKGVKKLIVE